MGKGKKGGRGGTKYVHNHTYNPVARESDERKIERLHNMEVKRYQNCVDRNMKVITQYLPLSTIAYKKQKVDPMYFLKGAARPAQEFYRPPGYQEDVEAVDLTVTHKGRLWDHEAEECRELLRSMSELSAAMHNVKGKTKEAIGVLKQMIELDNDDHMFAKQRLLRCYLDSAEAGEARALLDQYPEEPYCCFAYSRALIECIALLLEEADASVDLVDAALSKAYTINPYGLWTIALHEHFTDSVEHADRIKDQQAAAHSVVDAIRFFDVNRDSLSLNYLHLTEYNPTLCNPVDVPLWIETEGAVQHVRDYIVHYKLSPPSASSSSAHIDDEGDEGEEGEEGDERDEEDEGEEGDERDEEDDDGSDGKGRKKAREEDEDGAEEQETDETDLDMFIGMYETAIEMAADEDNK